MSLLRRGIAVLALAAACATSGAPELPEGWTLGERVEIFDGTTLTGWSELGDAVWTVEEGSILGRVGGGGQSFLVSERTFADFVLEVELRTELPGNSGIQVRSHVREDGRLVGYQIEIDPSDRAWSGGLYDEARRGWLDDLSDDPEARAAFRPGEWNHYRIECAGPRIRAWVNGVPTADFIDEPELGDAEGHLALQVHSGDDTRVRWRNFTLHAIRSRTNSSGELPRTVRKSPTR